MTLAGLGPLQLMVCGHSLGAGVASLLSIILKPTYVERKHAARQGDWLTPTPLGWPYRTLALMRMCLGGGPADKCLGMCSSLPTP